MQSPTTEDRPENPGVIAPPPLIFGVALTATWLLRRPLPIPLVPRSVRLFLGAFLLALGMPVTLLFFAAFRRAGTPIDVRKTPTALVTGGPFRYSRNPGYLSMAVIYAGLSLLMNSAAALFILPAMLAVIRHGVIRREERFLERRFGEAYRQYAARVPRWL